MKTNSKWFWQKLYSYFFKPKKLSSQEEIERLIKETNDMLKAEGKLWVQTPEEKAKMQVVFFPVNHT